MCSVHESQVAMQESNSSHHRLGDFRTNERTTYRSWSNLDDLWITETKGKAYIKIHCSPQKNPCPHLNNTFPSLLKQEDNGYCRCQQRIWAIFFRRDTAADLGHTAMLLLQLCCHRGGLSNWFLEHQLLATPALVDVAVADADSEWNHGTPSHTRQLPTATVSPSFFVQAHANSTYPDRSHSIMAICIK